jgi:VCBS repeat-containing protein
MRTVTVVNPCGSAAFFNGYKYSAIPAPGAFGKTSPANNATNVALNTPLTWGTSSDATSYEYCIETDGNNACNGTWTNVGTSTTASPALAAGFTYNWQVRAVGNGTTDADGGTWWSFSTIPANTAPVANNDGYSTPVVTLLNGTTVLVNDTDADLNPLTAILVTGPAHAASFTLNSNGTFAYTPAAAFSGVDTFTYKANDGTVDSNVATVTITVVNNAPTALTLSNRFIQEERPAGWLIGNLGWNRYRPDR